MNRIDLTLANYGEQRQLATARMRALDLRALLTQLDQPLKLLTAGARDAPVRHQTLRSTIAWSYELLDSAEQAALCRLAMFVGGCTLEAAQVVCQTGADALAMIDTLVANSLLQALEPADADVRITMLETVREFALEQLASAGELDLMRARHAEHAERAEAQLAGPGGLDWLVPLELEHDNFRAALEWCLAMAGDGGSELAPGLPPRS
jgi:predicted ATPase